MPQLDIWQQLLEAGMEFTQMTRAEAQRRAQKLVKEGQLAQERAQAFVDAVVDSSKRRADGLAETVRQEIQRQMKSLGLATKSDLAALERRLTDSPTPKAKSPAKTKKSGKKAAATKSTKAKKKPAAKAKKPAKKAG